MNRLNQGHSYQKIQSTHLWNKLNACEKGTYTNSIDPDETPQNVVSHQVCAVCQDKHILGNGRL